MTHRCPHCQKPIAVKMNLAIVTQEQFMDDYMAKNNKEKQDNEDRPGKEEKRPKMGDF